MTSNGGRSSNRGGVMGSNSNNRSNGNSSGMSKTAEKFKAACPPQKWRDLEQLVKQHNGDEAAIQARIMEWWEEGESAPKTEERWENVNKKKPRGGKFSGTGPNASSSSERGTGRDRGGGTGAPQGRGGRGGPSGGSRGRGGAVSGRGPKGGAMGKKPGADSKGRKQGGVAATGASTSPTAPSTTPTDNNITTLETPKIEQGFVNSNDPTPSGSTTVTPAFTSRAAAGGAGNVWATKGTAHIIEAEKPKPPPPKKPIIAPPQPPTTSHVRDLPSLEKDHPLDTTASSPADQQLDGTTLEDGIAALGIDSDQTNTSADDALDIPPTTAAVVDPTETETLLSEASSMAGLSSSVNGSNVVSAPPPTWKSVIATQNGGNALDLAPPAEESKTILKDELSVEEEEEEDAEVAVEEEDENEEPVAPVLSSPLSSATDHPVLPPQEIITSSPSTKPGQMNVLNLGRWDVNDGDDEQAIDFGFGSFGVEAEETPAEDEPSTEEAVLPASSNNGLPAVVTDKVTAAKEASVAAAASATLSPSRPPPGLGGLGSGAMPPMPAGAVLVHELEGKLEAAAAANNKTREAESSTSASETKVGSLRGEKTTDAAPSEEIKTSTVVSAPQAPVVSASEAPPAASVSVPSSSIPAVSGLGGGGGTAPSGPQGTGMYPNGGGGYGGGPGAMANMYSTAYSGIGGFMGAGVGMPTLLNPQHQAAAQQQLGQPNKGPLGGGPSPDHLGKDDATENTTSTTAASTAGNSQANPSSGASSASALNSAFPPGIMAYNPAAFGAGGFYAQHAGYPHHGHAQMAAGNQGLNGNVGLGPYGAYAGYPPAAQFGASAGGYASAYQQQLAAQMGVGGGPPGSNQSGSLGFGGGSAYGDSSGGNQSGSGLGDQHLGGAGSGNDSRGMGGSSGGYGGNKPNYRSARNNNSGGYSQGGGGYGSHSQQSQYSHQHNAPTGLHQQHGGLGGYGSGNPYSAGIGGYHGNQGMEHFQPPQRGYGGVNLHSHAANAYGMQQQSAYGNQGLGGGAGQGGGFGGQGQDASMDPFDSRGPGGHKGKGSKGGGPRGFGNQFQPVGGGQSFGALQPQGPGDHHGSNATSSAGGNSSSGGWGQQGWGGAGAGAGSVNSWQQGSGN